MLEKSDARSEVAQSDGLYDNGSVTEMFRWAACNYPLLMGTVSKTRTILHHEPNTYLRK
jgi:hypothetical protein